MITYLPEYQARTVEMVERRRQHLYRVDGVEEMLPSVTTVLKVIDKSVPMMGWARRKAYESVAAALTEYGPPDDNEDYGIWCDRIIGVARKPPKRTAADDGTDTHALIAAVLNHGSPLVPEHLRPAVQGAQEMISDWRLEVLATELPVWHPEGLYAGTIDSVARDADGRLVIMDWKRAKSIYPEHGYQLAAYASALEALTGETVASAIVVRLPQEPPTGYEARVVENRKAGLETFAASMRLWRALRKEIW